MKFTVGWKDGAEDEVAELWMSSALIDRATISSAVDEIERVLSIDPQQAGESRGDGCRLLLCENLACLFEVREQDCFVTVLRIWKVR